MKDLYDRVKEKINDPYKVRDWFETPLIDFGFMTPNMLIEDGRMEELFVWYLNQEIKDWTTD